MNRVKIIIEGGIRIGSLPGIYPLVFAWSEIPSNSPDWNSKFIIIHLSNRELYIHLN